MSQRINTLQWPHDKSDGVSNLRRLYCFLNRLFGHRSKNIKAPRHWPLWEEFTGHRWILRTKACDAENVSIWWRHHEQCHCPSSPCRYCGILRRFIYLAIDLLWRNNAPQNWARIVAKHLGNKGEKSLRIWVPVDLCLLYINHSLSTNPKYISYQHYHQHHYHFQHQQC